MSVITFPRRIDTRPRTQSIRVRGEHKVVRRSLLARWQGRSNATKIVVIALVALSVVLVGDSYAAQRQVEIHAQQRALLQLQGSYSNLVADLTATGAPARVANLAAGQHLVEPTLVSQIGAVSLLIPLPTPTLRGYYVVKSRIYK